MTLIRQNQEKKKKKSSLRYNEYYSMQNTFDFLYDKSKRNENFYKLYEIIISEENILLAYRTIKSNRGSTTKGSNSNTIKDIKLWSEEDIVKYIRKRLDNYNPQAVKRIFIPKHNGKMRPLGIPTIEDRIIQQCIRQVMEPICEAKFYDYSFGFRPNRSAKHAIARCYHLMQRADLHYVVDIDLKGFFDNVNHSKLLKQIYSLGIRDKRLISILSKMLKCEVVGEGIQDKGTPQGGILSPLLSNIVLNELDWWVDSQFAGIKTRHKYQHQLTHNRALKGTNLKEMHIVRYADDFKIFCRDYNTAYKIKIAVMDWLKSRLNLEINQEKSKIVNLKNNFSEFLGFKMKVHRNGIKRYNGNDKIKYTVKSYVSDKAVKNLTNKIKRQIKAIQHSSNPRGDLAKLNQMIFGYHNYYDSASHVCKSFHTIEYNVLKYMKNRLKPLATTTGKKNRVIEKYYGNSKAVKYYCDYAVIPIAYIKTRAPMQFKQETCDYTEIGRERIHEYLKLTISSRIADMMRFFAKSGTVEYNDNRISLFSAQNGQCAVTKRILKTFYFHCHHKVPKHLGGDDSYQNLVIVESRIHQLIHSVNKNIIDKYIKELGLNETHIKKINNYRKLCNLKEIDVA
ncbi:group II intron reverse transcriptase/maturase [Tepidibacter sp. Z1-5]|uniref:group II intron reverse transcriptase/maturase n=1 Tax=Tepidibacter sp. Z1-5 TaxID=3134138 RepID=UPI0030BCCFB2